MQIPLSSSWEVSMGHSPGTLMCGCAQIIAQQGSSPEHLRP